MKDEIRYTELKFLSLLAKRDPAFEYIWVNGPNQQGILNLYQVYYIEMIIALAEDGYVVFESQTMDLLVRRLRGELSDNLQRWANVADLDWGNPRDAIDGNLRKARGHQVRVTYRGLRRIEELRDLLKRDRILERFGVMLDLRYFEKDMDDALRRPEQTALSILKLDMDNFKRINDNHGHPAGDVVMEEYLKVVRNLIGSFGDCYRGTGDEVTVLMIGQSQDKAVELAEKIRAEVEKISCEYEGRILSGVSASIGVASSPPEKRNFKLEVTADDRQIRAKNEGKNRVVCSDK